MEFYIVVTSQLQICFAVTVEDVYTFRGITFLQLCPVIYRSLNEADDCRSLATVKEKIKLEEEAISEILVADTDLQSDAEASDVEDYLEEQQP